MEHIPDAQCMAYLPTFTINLGQFRPNLGQFVPWFLGFFLGGQVTKKMVGKEDDLEADLPLMDLGAKRGWKRS